jgi:hypothetical protein
VDARHKATAVRFSQNDCDVRQRLAIGEKIADWTHDFQAPCSAERAAIGRATEQQQEICGFSACGQYSQQSQKMPK